MKDLLPQVILERSLAFFYTNVTRRVKNLELLNLQFAIPP